MRSAGGDASNVCGSRKKDLDRSLARCRLVTQHASPAPDSPFCPHRCNAPPRPHPSHTLHATHARHRPPTTRHNQTTEQRRTVDAVARSVGSARSLSVVYSTRTCTKTERDTCSDSRHHRRLAPPYPWLVMIPAPARPERPSLIAFCCSCNSLIFCLFLHFFCQNT